MATALRVMRKESSRVRPGQKFLFDYWLLLTVAGLVVVGMLMVYSTTFDYGTLFHDDKTYFFRRQFIAAMLGVLGMVVVMQFDYHVFRRYSVLIMVGALGLLVVTLFVGDTIFGARRGLLGGSYQPSELAKLATILYISHWLSAKGERIKHVTYGLVPFSAIIGTVCALIVLQPDLGTTGLIAIVGFTIFFVAGADWRQFAIAGLGGAAIFLILVNGLPHAAARVDAFRAGLQDPSLASWHVQQVLVALASGGLTGVGLGQSTQKFGPLPVSHTDGVFAILGEELGLFGCLVVIGLFALFAWRGFRVARKARDSYGFLLALGITCWISFQALLNVAVITAVVPFTGITLPFMSYGGTSMAFSLIGVGILLNVSRDASIGKRLRGEPPQPRPAVESLRESFDLRWRNGGTRLPRFGRRR
jgi:cell division protein FtsW